MGRGKLITFEGIDGCGKTTQLRLLETYLAGRGIEFISTREPGGTELGEKIRSAVLHGDKGSVEPLAELLLYTADRAHHVRRVVIPALEAGKLVLSDRFYDATTVYQGFARGFDLGLVNQLNELSTAGLKPGLTLLFDLEVEIALDRTHQRHDESNVAWRDRLDSEPMEFHRSVRQAYLDLAAREPQRFRIIPAGGSVAETFELMIREVKAIVDCGLRRD